MGNMFFKKRYDNIDQLLNSNTNGAAHNSDISRYASDPCCGTKERQSSGDTIRTTNTVQHQSSTTRRIVVGLHNYDARAQSDVSFCKGDRMEVLDDSELGWWKVMNLRTMQQGLISWHFVAEERSVESQDWFFDNISRKEAEELLLSEDNPKGTFLVRPSEHSPQGYSLSVKDWEEQRGYHVKHYKIKSSNNRDFYITTYRTFPSLFALVLAYTRMNMGEDKSGIKVAPLIKPCTKPGLYI